MEGNTCEYNGVTYTEDDLLSSCDNYWVTGDAGTLTQEEVDTCDFCESTIGETGGETDGGETDGGGTEDSCEYNGMTYTIDDLVSICDNYHQ